MRRIAVILNRNARAVTRRVRALVAAELPVDDVFESASIDEAAHLARTIVARGYDGVLYGGGDGTLVVGLAQLRAVTTELPAIGVLRLGTGNAFAHAIDARGGADGLRATIHRARDPHTPLRRVRMLDVRGRWAPFCGFGVDALILDDQRAIATGPIGRVVRSSTLRYALSVGLRSIPRFAAGRRRPEVTLENLGAPAIPLARGVAQPATHDDVLWRGACTLAACATIPYFGFGLKMFASAHARDDRFQLRAGDAGLGEIVGSTRAAFRGAYFGPHVHDWLCDRVALSLTRPAPFEIGGELEGELDRVEIALGPALSVL